MDELKNVKLTEKNEVEAVKLLISIKYFFNDYLR